MRAEELRIGNYVEYNLSSGAFYDGTEINPIKIITINSDKDFCNFIKLDDDTDNVYDFDEIRLIPLTEEWLKKFGFKYFEPQKGFIYNIHFRLVFKSDFIVNQFSLYIDGNLWPIDIKYVHQLQNLYYVLTGVELTYEN